MEDAELRVQLEQYHTLGYGWALTCCSRDRAEAEDVLQTAYLKIMDGRANYDGRASFKTWLFAVIRNTAADERRRHWLRHLRLDGFAGEREHDSQPAERGQRLEQSERSQVFQQALAKLSRRQQEVLHLVFYQDLTVQQAAAVMGVGVGSARTHYERGKHRLRETLRQTNHFHEYEWDRQ